MSKISSKLKECGLPVGSLVHLDGVAYKVVKQDLETCEDCDLRSGRSCVAMICSASDRYDNEHVMFKKV